MFFRYPVSRCGSSAVSFFFMLSGLVAGYTMIGKQEDAGLRQVGTFLRKKIGKLYPLYFCTVIFSVMFTGLPEMLLQGDPAAGQQVRQLLRSLLLIQAWFPEGYFAYNGVGWFQSAMMFLYAMTLPAMAVLQKVNDHPKRYFLLAFLAGGLLFTAAVYCYITQ